MGTPKYGRRKYLTVVQSGLCERSRGGRDCDIFSLYQYFTFRVKHKRGSTRPEGTFHSEWSGSDYTVEVKWLYTDDLGYFAPEISFRPTRQAAKVANLVAKALCGWRGSCPEDRKTEPERFSDSLGAIVVEYINDQTPGCWNDYRVIRVPGDSEMMLLARQIPEED